MLNLIRLFGFSLSESDQLWDALKTEALTIKFFDDWSYPNKITIYLVTTNLTNDPCVVENLYSLTGVRVHRRVFSVENYCQSFTSKT